MSIDQSKGPTRYGMTIRVRPEHFAEYKRQHAAVWPEVLATITRHHIRNYSIYHRDGVLFSYFEYWGDDFAADMRLMAADAEGFAAQAALRRLKAGGA